MKKRIITIVTVCLLFVMLFTLTSCNSTKGAFKKIRKYIEKNGEYSESNGQYSLEFGDGYDIYFYEDNNEDFWLSYWKNGIQFFFCFSIDDPDTHYWSFKSFSNVKFSATGTMYSEEFDGTVKDIYYRIIIKEYEGSVYMKDTYEEIVEAHCYVALKKFDEYLQSIDIGVRLKDLGFPNYQPQKT